MNSLFRNTLLRSKDSILKESLQSQLVTCVKDIQLDHAHSGRFQGSNEAAEALCTVLEAIFIHGIKESLADRVALAMGDPDNRPEPNFWPALLVFSHRELIDQITGLNFISTDIGRCRAWLRLALNETLLTSYLQSMLAQNNILNSFYKRAAYLRDKELLDMSVTLISGVEAYSFSIACNSSLLNMWTNQPLLMAGVWSPAMKSCPITSGTDIAHSLMLEDSASRIAEDSVSSVVSVASFYDSSLSSSAFDEDEALKIILGAEATQSQEVIKNANTVDSVNNGSNNEEPSNQTMECTNNKTTDSQKHNNVESGFEKCTESAKIVEETSVEEATNKIESKTETVQSECVKPVEVTGNKVENQKAKLLSYHSLVESYNQTSTAVSKVPDLQDLLQKFQKPSSTSSTTTASSSPSDPHVTENLDFEVVSDNLEPSDIPDFRILVRQVHRIALEVGLDCQNYTCKTCTEHIGINFGPAKVCGLTGAYFCSSCFGADPTNEYWVIPARIIYNWDFRRYSVSHRAAEFLTQIQLYPLFDLSVINPKIYGVVEEMARLKELRVRLSFLSAYLLTCRDKAIESLQKQIWPREYLYEKIHHYSLSDLIQVSTGALESTIQKCVDLSRNHVVSCILCTQKGFICEICSNPKIIFPFDLDTTYRCKNCNAVYHAECLQAGQLCPKCLRIQQRLTSQAEIEPL